MSIAIFDNIGVANDPSYLDAFTGVGFALNPVAEISGSYNGQTDDNPADYSVQIDWGDGGGSSAAKLTVDPSNGNVLVKGSHIYAARGTYDVSVDVIGPGGQTASATTSRVVVTPMPDAASIPPDVPGSYSGSQALGDVGLAFFNNIGVANDPSYLYAFTGVGFALNPVAEVYGSYNLLTDKTLSDYHAQINWGDSPSWDTDTELTLDPSNGYVLVKGSHNYQASSTYDVTVYITGPDGQTASATTSRVVVTPMPDAASIPPDVPKSYSGSQPLGDVELALFDNIGEANDPSQLYAFTGVGFALNPVAEVYGSYNLQTDKTLSDYHAQINWGDSPSWDTNTELTLDPSNGYVLVKGSHNYQASSTYDVTVYITGPDGQTASATTSRVVVTPMPDAASIPPDVPKSYSGSQPLGDVGLALYNNIGVPNDPSYLYAFTGVGFALNPVAEVYGSYNLLTDKTLSDYHAQINWGDSPSWDTDTELTLDPSNGYVLVKGSHNYQASSTYDVTVYITGPDGQTASATTSRVVVTPMPDAASIPPDVPKSYSGSQPLGDVELALFDNIGEANDPSQLYAFTGVGFALNPVAEVYGSYNLQTDKTLSDYHAQINWGDSPSWDTDTDLTLDSSTGYIQVEGSHTYATAGTYEVTVYITGPDGQTASATTSEVSVTTDPLSVTLDAPNVTDSNAAAEVPYNFSLVFQNSSGLISGSSVSGAIVQVVPAYDEVITATLVSTQPSGASDGSGDASTIAANYQITPPNGDWSHAPMGTYSVNLVGSPVTGTSGGQALQGSVGTFQVNVAVKLVLEVPQYDTTVPEDGTIPVEVEALGPSGNPDPGFDETVTIDVNDKRYAYASVEGGNGMATVTAPNQAGPATLEASSGTLLSGGVQITVVPSLPLLSQLFDKAANFADQTAEYIKGLVEQDLKDPDAFTQAALKDLGEIAEKVGNVAKILPLAEDIGLLAYLASQPPSQQNEESFKETFSDSIQQGLELGVGTAVTAGGVMTPIGPLGALLLNTAVQEGTSAFFKANMKPASNYVGGQLYQSLERLGSSPLAGVSNNPGNGDPPPSIILVNPANSSSGAENLTVAGQAVYAQAGTSFSGVVGTFLDASGNTNPGIYNAYIAWGDGNFTLGTVSALPGGGFQITGSDTYATTGIYSVSVVVTSTDGSSAFAYDAASVYPASPSGATSAPVVSVLAPDISAENADWETPYTFSVVYQDPAMVSLASLAGSSVQVKPPNGPAVTALEIGTQRLGSTDALGDATTILVTYQITPPAGNWYAAAPGNYTVTVGGSPVTDLSGSPAPQGAIGTLQVSVPPTIQVSPDVSQLMGTTISNAATLTLSGYAEAGSTVEVYNGASAVGSVVAGAEGAWSLPYEAPEDGAYDFTAIATDSAGNTSAPSDDAPVEVDTLPPMSMVAALTATSQATFNVSWSGTGNSGGSGIAFYNVYVSIDGGPFTLWQPDTVSTSASYTGQAGHTYGFYSIATDYAGLVQPTPTTAQATTEVQTTAPPSEPPPPALLPADDSGIKGDGITDDASPSLIGTTQANATVQLQSGANAVVATTTADASGNYTFAVPGAPLSPGAYTFTVVASDASGSSAASNPFTLTIVAPPPTPSAPTLWPSDSNGSPGAETTTVTSPYVVGMTIADATVELLNAKETVVARTQTTSAGSYKIQAPGPLGVGLHPYSVEVVDQYGDVSNPSPTRTIIVVSQPAPVVTVTYTQDSLNKKHQVTEVVVIFSSAVNAAEADRTSTYHLATPGKGGSYTAKNAVVINLKSASYNPAIDMVTLTPAKPFASTKPVELVVYASGPNGLQDTHGRFINGGKNAVVFPTPGPVIHIEVSPETNTRTAPTPAAVDALLEQDSLIPRRRSLGLLRD